MPFKLKDDRRHKFDKTKYKVRNWREYEQGLVNRGSLTVWFSDEAIKAWKPLIEEKKKGRQPLYSDLAIQTVITLRKVYSLGLRQAEGFVRSIIELLELELDTPDHSTLSRRSAKLEIKLPKRSMIDTGKRPRIPQKNMKPPNNGSPEGAPVLLPILSHTPFSSPKVRDTSFTMWMGMSISIA